MLCFVNSSSVAMTRRLPKTRSVSLHLLLCFMVFVYFGLSLCADKPFHVGCARVCPGHHPLWQDRTQTLLDWSCSWHPEQVSTERPLCKVVLTCTYSWDLLRQAPSWWKIWQWPLRLNGSGQVIPLTVQVVERAWRMIQQRSSSSLFCGEAIVRKSGMSRDVHLLMLSEAKWDLTTMLDQKDFVLQDLHHSQWDFDSNVRPESLCFLRSTPFWVRFWQ